MVLLVQLEIKGMKFPLDRKYYTKDGAHIWLKQERNLVKIGMDAFAAEMSKPLTAFIVNKGLVNSGEEIGSFESTKYIGKFHSPISGEIISVNEHVLINPQNINENPYKSWIAKIKPDKNQKTNKYIIEGKDKILNWINKEIKKIY